MQTKIFVATVAFLLMAVPVFAAPTITSEDDQTFDQHQNIEQVRDITITDDATTPQITATDDIRIKIPKDVPVIWDDRVATVRVSGAAVEAGSFSNGTTSVTYEDSDKTAVIKVLADFGVGESVRISGLFLEGFYWSDENIHFELVTKLGNPAVAVDSRSFLVWTSSNDDGHEPEVPANIAVTQIDSGVQITWDDPSDMDASQIEILRGKAPLPVSGTPFAKEGRGVEKFIDTDLKIGDTVSYILRATDGRNLSALSEEFSITLFEEVEDLPVICTADYTPVCGSDEVTYANACNAEAAGITSFTDGECLVQNEPEAPIEEMKTSEEAGVTTEELQSVIAQYSDLTADHWSAGFLTRLTKDGVLNGYSDKTVRPNAKINRAELAKIAVKSFSSSEDNSESSFTDVATSDWFNPFVNALQSANATWISTGKFLPASGVSRGEAVWAITRVAEIEIPAITQKPFPDVSISHPYAAAIAWAKENTIISGYENGFFGIRDTLTRAQVAKIIVLFKQYNERRLLSSD